ncbi:hypothetical protein ACFV9D_18575 [Streptomyces sp. NPDC059875]|uniref:hypothetical protein n=1 Tax=unclassified Streptomyces TaxID=2593676 RepID=UPI0036577267
MTEGAGRAEEEEGEGEGGRDGRDGDVADEAGLEGAAVVDLAAGAEALGWSAVGPLSAPYATGTAPTTSQHATTGPRARVRVPRSPGVTG